MWSKAPRDWLCAREDIDLEEEVEALAEHPVEGGQVEEVGEGEGRAQQGLRQLRWHLVSSRREKVILILKRKVNI